jgi:hypothetical protein
MQASTAASTFRRISETEPGERAQRAAAGALVLACVERARAGGVDEFSHRRARAEAERLAKSPERSILLRLLMRVEADTPVDARVAKSLVSYACELERTHRLAEADAAVSLALAFDGSGSTTALHAARLARKLGHRERALALYCAARDLDGGGGAIARLAAVGEAAVSPDAVRALGRAIRHALAAGDAEAAAVGLEERAAARRLSGDRRGAARDLLLAGARFTDAVDRARVAHALAGVTLAAGDADGAREALRLALAFGEAPQRDHARTRLHTLSRDLGDQVGMRRWRSFKRPPLVSMSACRPMPGARSLAPHLLRWREALEQGAAIPSA